MKASVVYMTLQMSKLSLFLVRVMMKSCYRIVACPQIEF